jgi:hypothetical protein
MSQPIIFLNEVTLEDKINDGINNYKDHFCRNNFKGLNYSQLQDEKIANKDHNYLDTEGNKFVEIPKFERIEITDKIWIIDPPDCKDADDAWSINFVKGKLTLSIHIADPTELIKYGSPLYNYTTSILGESIYIPKNTLHLLPDSLVDDITLNKVGKRNSISIIITINDDCSFNYLADGNIDITSVKIKPSVINVNESSIKTYDSVGDEIGKIETFMKCKQEVEDDYNKCFQAIIDVTGHYNTLLKTLKDNINRRISTIKEKPLPLNDNDQLLIGILISKLYNAIMLQHKNPVMLRNYSDNLELSNTQIIKDMIAAFALMGNNCVAVFLKNLKDKLKVLMPEVIYRVSDSMAFYSKISDKHSEIGIKNYCHFTSPMRRAADLYNHYILKYYHTYSDNEINEGNKIKINEIKTFIENNISLKPSFDNFISNLNTKKNNYKTITTYFTNLNILEEIIKKESVLSFSIDTIKSDKYIIIKYKNISLIHIDIKKLNNSETITDEILTVVLEQISFKDLLGIILNEPYNNNFIEYIDDSLIKEIDKKIEEETIQQQQLLQQQMLQQQMLQQQRQQHLHQPQQYYPDQLQQYYPNQPQQYHQPQQYYTNQPQQYYTNQPQQYYPEAPRAPIAPRASKALKIKRPDAVKESKTGKKRKTKTPSIKNSKPKQKESKTGKKRKTKTPSIKNSKPKQKESKSGKKRKTKTPSIKNSKPKQKEAKTRRKSKSN